MFLRQKHVVNSLMKLAPGLIYSVLTVCGSLVLGLWFCFTVLSVLSSFAIISLRKKQLVALLCLHAVVWLSLFCASLVGWSAVFDCGISWSYSLTFSCVILMVQRNITNLHQSYYYPCPPFPSLLSLIPQLPVIIKNIYVSDVYVDHWV